jgi:hypothetical protein
VQAEALVARKKVTDEDRQKATELITRLAKSKLPPAELARVALRIDPTLPTTLGLPLPEGAVPAVAPEPPPSRRRRGR